ncbi:MAG: hypothetical protein MJZ48_02765 [Paludibacteraceae bacterium]|nr:hypothetical protein [Paludibacteraceae bacterium]
MAQLTYYEYLLSKQESGELKTLFALGLPCCYRTYLDIYSYHLSHPKASQFTIALELNTSKRTVFRALHILSTTIPD